MSDAHTSPPDSVRLNGWKDIANHVGKGVRTVQRWEKVYGLPVHRLGEEGGEIVFAFRDEVDAWLRSKARARGGLAALDAEADAHSGNGRPAGRHPGGPVEALPRAGSPPVDAMPSRADAPVRPRRRALAVTALLLVAAAAVGAWIVTRPPRMPATWKVEQDTLLVYDADGTEMWSYRFEGPVAEEYFDGPAAAWATPVAIEDLDGDRRPEVLVQVVGAERQHSDVLRCFNGDGSLRWARRLDDRVRFGQETYAPPWAVRFFRVLPNGDGTRSVWATFIHGMKFPTVLERLTPDGTVTSRYWSNGYVESVSLATWQGRQVVLVGACNNEVKGSSLAILDAADATGTAPAVATTYRCTTCPQRDPLAFVVFPGSPLRQALREPGSVEQAWVTAEGGVVALVKEHAHGAPLSHGHYHVTLDADLRPVSVEVTNQFIDLLNWFHRAGRLDHPYSPAVDRQLLPVLHWRDGRFVELGVATP